MLDDNTFIEKLKIRTINKHNFKNIVLILHMIKYYDEKITDINENGDQYYKLFMDCYGTDTIQ